MSFFDDIFDNFDDTDYEEIFDPVGRREAEQPKSSENGDCAQEAVKPPNDALKLPSDGLAPDTVIMSSDVPDTEYAIPISLEKIFEDQNINVTKDISHGVKNKWYPVSDLYVLNRFNQIEPLTGLLVRGINKVLKIKVKGHSIICGANHRLLVETPNGPQWRRAADIKKGDVLCAGV